MNFKQLVLEELINYDDITFTVKGKKYADAYSWTFKDQKTKDNDIVIYLLKDSKNGNWQVDYRKDPFAGPNFGKMRYRICKWPTWWEREKGGYKRGVERGDFNKKLRDSIPKLVELFELKQQLSNNTAKTFGGLIDEL